MIIHFLAYSPFFVAFWLIISLFVLVVYVYYIDKHLKTERYNRKNEHHEGESEKKSDESKAD